MNILVTGAGGQLGREMIRAVEGTSHRYFFTTRQDLDIADTEAVRAMVQDNGIDLIVNCAAYTDVNRAESDRDTADLMNHVAVGGMATVMKERGGTLVHISTDYVFDGNACVPYRETDPTCPVSVYGETKLKGEQAIIDSGCNYLIFRTSWLYSEWGKNFVKTMLGLFATKDRVNVVFDQVGTPTYAGDLAVAVAYIIESGQTGKIGIYHYSNEGVCSWYDFAKRICELSGNVCEISPCHSDEFPSPVARPHYSVMDKTLVKTVFGLKIPHWNDSLVACLKKI